MLRLLWKPWFLSWKAEMWWPSSPTAASAASTKSFRAGCRSCAAQTDRSKEQRARMRSIAGVARTLLALLFLVAIVPIAALVAFPWTFISGKINFLYFVGMNLAFASVRIAGARVKIIGLDKIDPSGTYIFMSNHVSNLDPPILCPLIPRRTSVLAKKT